MKMVNNEYTRLFLAMQDKQVSSADLSKQVKMPVDTVNKLMTGQAIVSMRQYEKIAAVLGVPVADILDFDIEQASTNKKVRGARKCVKDGIKFDSKLEMEAYSLFKALGISAELKPKFELQPLFYYRRTDKHKGETVRAITITPDFYLSDHKIIVDTKGHQTEGSILKFKMLKYYLNQFENPPQILLIANKSELDKFCNRLINSANKNKSKKR